MDSIQPLAEARIREIVREEIEWALKLVGAQTAAQPVPRRAGGGRKPDLARYRLFANRYEEGATILEIATEFGACQETVRKALKSLGVVARPFSDHPSTRRPHPHLDEMKRLRAEGATLDEIGGRFSLTRERVRQILKKAGVPTDQRPLNAREREAVARYVAGDSLEQVAQALGTQASTMRNIILRAGHQIRPSSRQIHQETLKKAEAASQLYRQGKTLREIAASVGVSKPEMIYRLLAIAGVKPNRQRKLKKAA